MSIYTLQKSAILLTALDRELLVRAIAGNPMLDHSYIKPSIKTLPHYSVEIAFASFSAYIRSNPDLFLKEYTLSLLDRLKNALTRQPDYHGADVVILSESIS